MNYEKRDLMAIDDFKEDLSKKNLNYFLKGVNNH